MRPASSSTAMSLRIVADETPRPPAAMALEPTGSRVATYWVTMARRTSSLRFCALLRVMPPPPVLALLLPECQCYSSQAIGGDMRAAPGVRPARTSHRSAVVLLRPGHGDKVDEFLDPPQQRGFKVAVGTHSGQDPLPPEGDVALVSVRPTRELRGVPCLMSIRVERQATARGQRGRA